MNRGRLPLGGEAAADNSATPRVAQWPFFIPLGVSRTAGDKSYLLALGPAWQRHSGAVRCGRRYLWHIQIAASWEMGKGMENTRNVRKGNIWNR